MEPTSKNTTIIAINKKLDDKFEKSLASSNSSDVGVNPRHRRRRNMSREIEDQHHQIQNNKRVSTIKEAQNEENSDVSMKAVSQEAKDSEKSET